MRVVLVVPEFPKRSETFIASKFRGLVERGWDMQVVCTRSEAAQFSSYPDLLRPGLRTRIHASWPARPRWRAALLAPAALGAAAVRQPSGCRRYFMRGRARLGNRLPAQAYLDARLIELQPDIVHFEFGALAAGRMYLREALACPVIVSFRGYDINFVGLEQPDYYREVWEEADMLHFLGHGLRRRAISRGCPADKPHALIAPAIDTSFFDGRVGTVGTVRLSTPDQLRIVSVGRLTWQKGYEYAMVAIKHLIAAGVHCRYTIVGEGPYLQALAFARHELGLDEVVEFVGGSTREQVREHMRDADVFLHAAVSEGFCNAVIEAQAMELPVVCSDADGLPENVADGETGFVVPRRDAPALFEKLAVLAGDPALRRRLGEAGRRRAVGRFQLTDQLDAWEALYRAMGRTEHRAARGGPRNTAEVP
jgi:colanic acid/amylovoran biosynthesis glycosyltransferase